MAWDVHMRPMDFPRDDLRLKHVRRRWIIGVGATAVAAAAIASASLLGPAIPQVDRNSVWIDTVKRGEMLREVRGQGALSPKDIRWVTAQTRASVARILVRPGVSVAIDTTIMELTNPEVTEALQSARAAVAAARADGAAKRMAVESQLLEQKASVAQIRAAYELAQAKVVAFEQLVKQGVIAKLTFKEYQLNADQNEALLAIAGERAATLRQTLQAQVAADQARVRQLEDAFELRRRLAEGLHVQAGSGGVLQSIAVQEGQQVAAGENLARIVQPDRLRAELLVAETQAKDVSVGQRVSIDTRNGVVQGHVERVDPAVQHGSVQVDVEFDGPLPAGARPALSIDGTIEIDRVPDAVYMSRPTIAQPDSRLSLYRVSADGKSAERVPVQLGRASVALIEVVRGLSPGDRVVLSDTAAWEGYDRIRLR
jgi:HlyD family secretion protein